MSKGQIVALVIAAIVVVGVVAYLGTQQPLAPNNGGADGTPADNNQQPVPTTEVAPGANPVSESGEVVTPEGKPVKLDVAPNTPEAPRQSEPISESDVPKDAIKLKIGNNRIEPSEFTVSSGELVKLSVTSVDGKTHVFKFRDPALKAVAIGIGSGRTRLIPFNAPKAGTYEFYCDVPGHDAAGENGKMIVK